MQGKIQHCLKPVKFCSEIGGFLCDIKSEAENNFLADLIDRFTMIIYKRRQSKNQVLICIL